MNYFGLHYMVYANVVQAEIAFIMSDLTLLNISFGILICQNKVKKNCKFIT